MMLTVASTVGKTTTMDARDDIFGVTVEPTLIAQAIRVHLANQRQGTAKTKTRSEINRTKKKWFKQKGTGNARHGARTPSLFVGGGVAHGPHGNQNWSLKMSATMRRRALAHALTAQVKQTIVCDDLLQLDGKTASADKLLHKMLPTAKHVLVVLANAQPMMLRSMRNLEYVFVTTANRLHTYEVAYADAILFTKEAVKMVEARLTPRETRTTIATTAATEVKVKTVAAEVATPKSVKTPKTTKTVKTAKKTGTKETQAKTKKVAATREKGATK